MSESEKVCTKANLGLNHKNPKLFVTSQWGGVSVIYPVYRTIVAVYCCLWIVISGAKGDSYANRRSNEIKWFIYLTNWSFLLLNVSLIVRSALSVWGYQQLRHDGRRALRQMTWFLKMSWVLYDMSSCVALTVTLAYWAFIWTPDVGIQPIDFNTHGMNSIFVVVDVLITAMPIRLLHFYFPMIFAAIYVFFSLIYDLAGGTNALDQDYIYEILDWSDDPGNAALYSFILSFIAGPALWFLLWCLFKIRVRIYRRFNVDKEPSRAESFMMDTYSFSETRSSVRSKTSTDMDTIPDKNASVRSKKSSTVDMISETQTSVRSKKSSTVASISERNASVRSKKRSVGSQKASPKTQKSSVRSKKGPTGSQKGTSRSQSQSLRSTRTSVGSQKASSKSQRGSRRSNDTSSPQRPSVKSINWAYTHEEVEG